MQVVVCNHVWRLLTVFTNMHVLVYGAQNTDSVLLFWAYTIRVTQPVLKTFIENSFSPDAPYASGGSSHRTLFTLPINVVLHFSSL